jgi:hypothetical protein
MMNALPTNALVCFKPAIEFVPGDQMNINGETFTVVDRRMFRGMVGLSVVSNINIECEARVLVYGSNLLPTNEYFISGTTSFGERVQVVSGVQGLDHGTPDEFVLTADDVVEVQQVANGAMRVETEVGTYSVRADRSVFDFNTMNTVRDQRFAAQVRAAADAWIARNRVWFGGGSWSQYFDVQSDTE